MRFASTLALLLLAAPAFGQLTTRASVDTAGGDSNHNSHHPSLSADGSLVAFYSFASDLVASDKNGAYDVFVRDLASGVTERVSVDSAGGEANSSSWYPAISADGSCVAFESDAKNLVAGDTNGSRDVFVHDRTTGVTERVSVDSAGAEGNGSSSWASISADGRYVAFESLATNLVAGDTNGWPDVFVHDRVTGITERVSVDSTGAEGNGDSHRPELSGDGSIVAFASYATNLVAGDTNFRTDIFVHDRASGVTERVSVDSSGLEADRDSSDASISADGRIVAFASAATNLDPAGKNGYGDVFVHDRSSGSTALITKSPAGVEGDKSSVWPHVSEDGRSVAFYSYASNLVAGDGNGGADAFVRDLATGFTDRMSVDTAGGDSNGDTLNVSISGDGRVVAFASRASDLVGSDGNGAWDVFARDRCVVHASWTNYGAGFPGTQGVPSFTAQSNPVLGTTLSCDLANSSGVPTPAALFVGFQRTQIAWRGGDLLVLPTLVVPFVLPAAGTSFVAGLPTDFRLGGLILDLQAAELDSGAAKGISSTPGLELVLGI
jgi:hypothetical protein